MGDAKRKEGIMEEELKKTEEAMKPDAEPAKYITKIEIVMMPDGNIGVKAPIGNKPLCKALLEGAWVIIEGSRTNNIVTPNPSLIGRITGRG